LLSYNSRLGLEPFRRLVYNITDLSLRSSLATCLAGSSILNTSSN